MDHYIVIFLDDI